MLRPLLLAYVAVVGIFVSGCGSVPDATPVQQGPDGGEPSGDSDGGGTSPAVFDEALAIAVASDALSALAQATVAISPLTDLQDIFEDGAPLPTCPILDTTIDPGAIQATLNYGAGCTPQPFVSFALAGDVTGGVFTTVGSFEAALTSIGDNGTAIDGAITSTYARDGNATTFSMTLSLTTDVPASVSGGGTVVLDETTGVIAIADLLLSVTQEEALYTVDIAEATIDPNSAGSTDPTAGAATVTLVGGQSSIRTFDVTLGS